MAAAHCPTSSRQHPQDPLPAKPRACSCHSWRCSRPEGLGAGIQLGLNGLCMKGLTETVGLAVWDNLCRAVQTGATK